MPQKLAPLADDGLITEDIGAWGEEKYRLLGMYAQIFSASMKNKWDCRVYIDLFSGPGHSRVRGTNRIVTASPFVALNINPKFDRYIFCEKDATKMLALQTRIASENRHAEILFVPGDANTQVEEILDKIPQPRRDFKVLSLCFVDPYNLKDLWFQTIVRLSSRRSDFLVLIATDMDANRNVAEYESPGNETIERFLDIPDWRDTWREAKSRGESFGLHILGRFSSKMEKMGYIRSEPEKRKHVRSTAKNLPLYHLALFTRHPLGMKFWQEAKKYSDDQLGLFDN